MKKEYDFSKGVRGKFHNGRGEFNLHNPVTKEIAPLILTGPPAVTSLPGGRPKVEEIMAYFPALIPKSLVETKVDIVEASDF